MKKPKHREITSKVLKQAHLNPVTIQQAFEAVAPATAPGDPLFSREGYLTHSFLSKFANPSADSAVKRQEDAIKKLMATEKRNLVTHDRLLNRPQKIHGFHTEVLFSTAQRLIHEVIGDFDYGIFALSEFSNGASTSRRRGGSDPIMKSDGKGDITLRARPYMEAYIKGSYSWSNLTRAHHLFDAADPLRPTRGNEIFTVPKDNEIDRAAAKEPDYNMFLQRACGKHIRASLFSVGINLHDQTKNQKLAKLGSETGKLATIDLSAASDSITWALCKKILPGDWMAVLDDLRSPHGFVNDAWHEWILMSTMGNGYTFELETLIFWALARAVQYHSRIRGVISVYGDDIILPVQLVPFLKALFGYSGFILNSDKSFWTGSFRESCGKHYFNGIDVTPFYCREPLNSLTRVVWFSNQLRKWAGAFCGICDPRYASLALMADDELRRSLGFTLTGGTDMDSDVEHCKPGLEGGFYIHFQLKRVKLDCWAGLSNWFTKTLTRNVDLAWYFNPAFDVRSRRPLNGITVSRRMVPKKGVQLRPLDPGRRSFGTPEVPYWLHETS